MSDKIINPFINIPILEIDDIESSPEFQNMRAMNIGFGSKVFRADEQGVWLGAEKFGDAPFSVDMDGNVILTSAVITGYFNKTSDDLDDIDDGTNWGKVAKTAISAGKIVLTGGGGVDGVLPVGNTDADITADNAQAYAWLTGSKPPVNADHTADIVSAMAYESLVESAKLGTTIISGGYIKSDLLTANNILVGTLPVARTQAKCTNANADQTSANAQSYNWLTGSKPPIDADKTSANTSADTNKVQGYTLISGGYIATGRITCSNIGTGTLTGRTVQTSSSGERIKLDGSGNNLYFYNSSGTLVGKIDINGTNYFRLESSANAPYGMTLGANNNVIAIISTAGMTMQGSYKISGNEADMDYLTGTKTLRFVSTASPLTDNGSIYFNGSHFYGRISGAWRQLDN